MAKNSDPTPIDVAPMSEISSRPNLLQFSYIIEDSSSKDASPSLGLELKFNSYSYLLVLISDLSMLMAGCPCKSLFDKFIEMSTLSAFREGEINLSPSFPIPLSAMLIIDRILF